MLTTTEMIQIIRSTVHDVQELEYTDDHIIGVLNSGLRFIRRQVRTIRPQMLLEPPIIGTLAANVGFINLPIAPTKIIDIYVDGSKIEAVNFLELSKPQKRGRPTKYYLTGQQTLNFYPVPDIDIKYIVRVVGSAIKLDSNSISPLPDDMDDFLIEYACIRLSYANEFDMSQETQLLGSLIEQIRNNVLSIEEPAQCIDGYFSTPIDGVTTETLRGKSW